MGKSAAFEAGKSLGDDAANFALSYGQKVPEQPTRIPPHYDEGDFRDGWKAGVQAARQRDKDLG
jgi:hypothetical protein